MKRLRRSHIVLGFASVLMLISDGAPAALAQGKEKGTVMVNRASGTFEVEVKPLPADEKVVGLTVGRYGFEKRFAGDLEGTSKGEMVTAETSVEGSGG
jgi:predicted naringenin-chalcone synthase